MGLFDSLTNGQGTPWGAPNDRGQFGGSFQNPWNALTQGQGTPWGAGGQKSMEAFADPFTLKATGNQGYNTSAAFGNGQGTPWGASGERGMDVFQDPLTKGALAFTKQNAKGSEISGLNSGIFDVLGHGADDPTKPNTPTLLTDPSQFKAPDYSAYNQAGQANINKGLARSRNAAAAGMQKHGELGSGDTGLAFGDIDQGGMESRGGLANAISNMQLENQYGQLNAANQGIKDKYSNDFSNYQNALGNKNANRKAATDTFGTALGIASRFIGA